MSFDKAEVKEKANGQWDFVVSRLVPEMAGVVDEAVTRPSRHYRCHIHGGEKDMRFYRDFLETGGAVCTCGKYPDGFALIGAANGWSFSETVDEVGKLVFGSSFEESKKQRVVRSHQDRVKDKAKEDAKRQKRILSIWKNTKPFEGSLVEVYLRARGISFDLSKVKNLRFSPKLENWEEVTAGKWKRTGEYPGLVACMHDANGLPVTLHRIYLSQDGRNKAVIDDSEMEDAKKMCAAPSFRVLEGSAIRLCDAKEVLGVAEGIETALAVMQLFGVPCWATANAYLMEEFIPPKGIKKVEIYADKDRSETGIVAAKKLASRLRDKGIEAVIKLPKASIPEGKKGIDWLDVLCDVTDTVEQ